VASGAGTIEVVRAGIIAVVLAGCGRFGFEPAVDGVPRFGFRDLCAFERLTVVKDDVPNDDAVGAAILNVLGERCGVQTRTVSQDQAGILDPATDRLLLGRDELAILAGGDGPHRAVAYLLMADTPVTWEGDDVATYRERATGRTLAVGPVSATHDYALVMIVDEPVSGTRALSVSGMNAVGTVAAGYWFRERVGTDEDGAWILVEWTEADAEAGPSDGDTWIVVGSG
jgi:hypothetical protein